MGSPGSRLEVTTRPRCGRCSRAGTPACSPRRRRPGRQGRARRRSSQGHSATRAVCRPLPASTRWGRPRKFAYRPNLVVVDGGLPQANAAVGVLAELGIDDLVVVGLAKRLEEVWRPGQDYPVILPRTSEGLYLLQRVRDEAHRFAIAFHRQRRGEAMTTSVLDGIPGLGPSRRAALLARFGSVKRLRAATPDQLQEVPGVGPALATAIILALARDSETTTPTVNVTTGEILD